jgi:hypothetical protein
MMPIAINGRFLTQGMTGVQRFAREITAAADRLVGNDAWPEARLLMPSSVAESPFAYLKAQAIGQRSGQFWEQWDETVRPQRGCKPPNDHRLQSAPPPLFPAKP